jgi:hypothetical protein
MGGRSRGTRGTTLERDQSEIIAVISRNKYEAEDGWSGINPSGGQRGVFGV